MQHPISLTLPPLKNQTPISNLSMILSILQVRCDESFKLLRFLQYIHKLYSGARMQATKKTVKHFHLDFQLPKFTTFKKYQKFTKGAVKAKNKHRFQKFTYYKTDTGIIKALFLNQNEYVDQGTYPFTDPSGDVKNIKNIQGSISRIIYVENVYVGHFTEVNEKGEITYLIMKKLNESKIDAETSEIETKNDDFELIPVGNVERFSQFLKVQQANPNAAQMSIRVIVDQKFGEQKQSQVLDFEFFKRQSTLKANQKYLYALMKPIK